MKNNLLKSALETVYMQEMDSIPPQQILESEYSFSAAFKAKMEDMIKQANRDYITVFGIAAPRNRLVLALAALILLPVGWLYYKGIIDRSAARLSVAVAEFFLLAAFGTNMRRETRRFTGGYSTAFADGEENPQGQELEFSLPVPPEGYTKTNEYRTTVSHMIEYKDALGRIILYTRVNIEQGVLTRIDTDNADVSRISINGNDAALFVKDGQTNLVWADKFYRYHLKGSCTKEMLTEMADSIK